MNRKEQKDTKAVSLQKLAKKCQMYHVALRNNITAKDKDLYQTSQVHDQILHMSHNEVLYVTIS